MGNKNSQNSYSFQNQYDILDNRQSISTTYKLKNKQNHELYIGKQLSCNDEHETYQIQCIINQKLNNPSPFVTKLLQSQYKVQQSYCSNNHKYYLLYKEVGRVLDDQISHRSKLGKIFGISVAKGIKYLYDINFHHGVVSSKAITWPSSPKQQIQLIDLWALQADHNSQIPNKIYRPKDDEDINQKTLQRTNDLFELGIVARQMLNTGTPNHHTNQIGYQQLVNKIQILTSHQHLDRLIIYNITSYGLMESRTITKEFDNNIVNQHNNPNFNMQGNKQVLIQQENKQIQSKTNINIKKTQKVQFYRPSIQAPLIAQNHGKDMQFSANNIQTYHNKSTNNPTAFNKRQEVLFTNTTTRNIASVPKANITINSRKNSIDKVQALSNRVHLQINHNNPPIYQNNLTNITQISPKIVPSTSNKTITSESGNINIPAKSIIQFNNHTTSQTYFPTNTLHQKTSLNGSSVGRQSSSINFSHNQPIYPIMTTSNVYETKSSLAAVNSSLNIQPVNLSINNQSNLATGLNYSFGQNSDKTFSFKAKSSGEQNLFTSPQFFNKINQSVESKKQQSKQYIKNNSNQQKKQQNFSTHNQHHNKQTHTSTNNFTTIIQNNETNYRAISQHNYVEPQILVHQNNNIRPDYDYLKATPNKNNRSNQPFSTIPQVSERSASARTQQQRDFIIQQYENGSRYEGFKSNGMRNGKGKFYYQEGSYYDGQWKNNNMHGFGRLYYSNNKLAYQGYWFIDQFHGKGKVYNDEPAPIYDSFDYTNFDNLEQKWKYYEGYLVTDSKQGVGKLVLSNDEYYQGQFKNDKVDGKGRFVTKNGQVINGLWQDSKLVMRL